MADAPVVPSTVVSQLLTYMDKVSLDFVSQNLVWITLLITPLVALGLTISIVMSGLATLLTGDGEPISELVSKFIRYAIIISIASFGGWYQKDLARAALKIPDEFASFLVVNKAKVPDQKSMGNSIDSALDKGISISKKAFGNVGLSGSGVVSAILGLWSMMVTAIMCGVGAAFILMAKFWLALTVTFGPIFIFCLLWEATRRLFDKWIGSIISYGLVVILVSAVFGLMIKFYDAALSSALKGSGTDIVVTMVSAGVITIVSIFVMLQIPEKASSWGDGITVASRSAFRGGSHLPKSQNSGNNNTPTPQPQPTPQPKPAESPGAGQGAGKGPGGAASQVGSQMTGAARGSRR